MNIATESNEQYTDKDLEKIRQLRNYYRREFQNGKSDEAFLLWIEDGLKALKKEKENV